MIDVLIDCLVSALVLHDEWFERRRQMNALKFAGAKLTKPKLVACIKHWQRRQSKT